MAELNIRNVTLMALTASCLLQLGGQLFALSVVASTIAEAPPRSFAILQGDYRYDSSTFWETLPPITALLFVIALVANWKTRRRMLIAGAAGLFVLGALLAGFLVEPEFARMTATGYSNTVDPELQSRARTWLALDWAVWSVVLLAGITLLLALATPASARQAPAPPGLGGRALD